VREQIAAQQACLELLDHKIDHYRRTLQGPGEGA
jgi:hypothetical protein